MYIRLIFIAFSLSPLLACSQSNYTDSLSSLIQKAKEDTTKVTMINDLVTTLRDKDPNEALEYAQNAKALSERLKFRKGLGNTLQNIGWIYYRKGDYLIALQNSLEALAINKEFGDKTLVANCLNNIGAIQYEQKQYASALSYFKQGYRLANEIQNSSIMSRSLNNISYCYLSLNKLDSAEYYVKIAIRTGENADDRLRTGFSERILGDIYFEKQQWRNALESFTVCLESAQKRNLNSLIVSTLHRIGKTLIKLNNPDAAIIYLNENVEKTVRLGYKDELEKTYALLTEAYVQKADLVNAYRFQKLYMQIHDTLYNKNRDEQIALVEAKYKDEIKENRIALLTKDKELQDKEISNQRFIIYLFVLALLLVTGLAYVLYSSNHKVKKAYTELAEKNEEVKSQSAELIQLNTTKNKLFSIISHDLRSPIAGLRGLLNLVSLGSLNQDEFINVSKQVRHNLDYLHEDLDNLLRWAHSQLEGFDPSLQYISLYEIIQSKMKLFDSSLKAKDISIRITVNENLEMYIDPDHLDLIIRNLMSNAIKFSHRGGVIEVKGEFNKDQALLSIKDFGIGMSEEDLQQLISKKLFTKYGTQNEKGMGLGFHLVKEFVEKNDGSIHIESKFGEGSEFIIEMRGRLKS